LSLPRVRSSCFYRERRKKQRWKGRDFGKDGGRKERRKEDGNEDDDMWVEKPVPEVVQKMNVGPSPGPPREVGGDGETQ